MSAQYVHGFDATEQERLCLQAGFLENMVHQHLDLSSIKHMLEIGCGVGAQTIILLQKYPNLRITAIDQERRQIAKAKENLKAYPQFADRVTFVNSNTRDFQSKEKYDGAFFCWVLEHVHSPTNVLNETKKLLTPGASIFLTEVFHHSFYTYPESKAIQTFWNAFADLQMSMDGHPDIGVKLGNLLHDSGFQNIDLYTIGQHWDKRDPKTRAVFIDYFHELAFTAEKRLLENKLVNLKLVEQAHAAFETLKTNEDAIIYYRGFQATATV